jgi:surface polysaccharide O-acyltransferase-like enzyme
MNLEVEGSQRPRLIFLDNIKLLFTILVIFQHARVTYEGSGWWYYIESFDQLDLLSTIVFRTLTSIGGFFQIALMGLFFLMGGYFTPRSYDRKGLSTFWKERLTRLGIPLLLYIILINPIMYYILAVLEIQPWSTYPNLQGSLIDYYLAQPDRLLDFLTNTGPMWFLYVLLIFTFVYTLWRQITNSDSVKHYIPREFSIPRKPYLLFVALILGIITFLFRIVSPIDEFPLGIPFGSIIVYLMMFSVGVIALRYHWFEQMSKNDIKVWLGIMLGVMSFVILYILIAMGLDSDMSVLLGGPQERFVDHIPAFLFAIAENINAMGMIFVLIPVFSMKFNEQGPFLKSFSASAFYMYLIHAPILVAVSLVFASIPLFPLIKLIIVFPLTVGLCYLVSHYFLQKIL